MRPPKPISESRLSELNEFRKNKWPGFEFQRFLCVWLRVEQGLATKDIARVLGWHVNTVRYTQADFIKNGTRALVESSRGGRRRQLMTAKEEAEFLSAFASEAEKGRMLVVNDIKDVLESHLDRQVHKTTVYRMLNRHGWRKICPRPKHPKQNPEAIEGFKKGASQKG